MAWILSRETRARDFRDTFEDVLLTRDQLGLRNVNFIQGYFDEVARTWTRRIDILHIDGNHAYEAVKNDYLIWKKFVNPTGVILFHDTSVPHFGVRRLFNEIALSKLNFANSHGLGVVFGESRLGSGDCAYIRMPY